MKTFTLENAIVRIKELTANGLEKAKIRATLTLEDFPSKLVTEAFKAMNVSSKVKTFASEYYDYLSASRVTKENAELYITGRGEYGETSANVKKHLSHYLNIWELTDTIWAAKGNTDAPKKESEKNATDKAREKAEKMRDEFEAGKTFTKREINSVHPDRVASLEDKELTALYNWLYKALTA